MSRKMLALALVLLAGCTAQASKQEPAPKPAGKQDPAAEPVTFNKHVAPILWSNCSSCHHAGAVAPFPLLSYKDAQKRAAFLRDVTATKRMPPWRADPGYGPFNGAPHITDDEIKTIARWVECGAPEGDPKDLGRAPTYQEGGWKLGPPDLVLTMPCDFTIPAGGPDIFRCFVIPIPVTEDKIVNAVEFHPGNAKVIFHAGFVLDNKGQARKKDGEDGRPGYTSPDGPGPGIEPTGNLGGWGLTTKTRFLPDGVGMPLAKGSDLVLWFHYHPTGKEETDHSELGIFFAKKPVTKFVANLGARTKEIIIPPGENRHRVTCESAPFPVDVTAMEVSAHMHFVGREISAKAVLPDGKTVPLLGIKDWDFNWSELYEFQQPPRLPKGTVIQVEAFFDNSDGNPRNPNKPARLVTYGRNITTEEMLGCGVRVIADSADDLKAIEDATKKETQKQKEAFSALTDIEGKKHTILEWKGKSAVVLFFIGTECPVSNSYAPEYVRLSKAFAAKGVAFFGIHPDPEVTAEQAAKHAKDYGIDFPILLAPTQAVTTQKGITIVPEAVVLSAEGTILYRGRVDDRYSLDGKRREEPSVHELEVALQAVLDGKLPPVLETKPFGCPLPEARKQEDETSRKGS
ncbi:redoxin domain-containing protein [bacterium]|nr:redoxin domain-containing protein [bacterium]